MEALREKWTDERLDDLNGRVDDLGRRMDLRFDSMERRSKAFERRFERFDERMVSMTRVMIHGFVAMGGAMATGFVTLAALIVSH
jgi:hypothetical protein